MKNTVQDLSPKDITSEVFIIAPSQIDAISKKFGNAVAESMNMRPLAQKIEKLAKDILTQTLYETKNMGQK